MAEARAHIRPIMAEPMLLFKVQPEIWVAGLVGGLTTAILVAMIFFFVGLGPQLTPATLSGAVVGGGTIAWFFRATLIDPFYLMRVREYVLVRPRAADTRSRVPGGGKRFIPGL